MNKRLSFRIVGLAASACLAGSPLTALSQGTNFAKKPFDFPLVGDFGIDDNRFVMPIETTQMGFFVPPAPAVPGAELKFGECHENKTYSAETIKHYNKGFELHKRGYLDDALMEYRAALHIDKNFSQAWCNIGGIFNSRKLDTQAIEAFNKALATTKKEPPGRIYALRGLASLYAAQGSYAEAEPLYKEAVTIGPTGLPPGYYILMMFNYASLLRKMHRVNEAEDLEIRARQFRESEVAK